MFTPDFYPTPAQVIEQMLQGLTIEGKIILEPSAGSGNLVKALQQAGAKEVLGCENDPELIKIARTYCNVIERDFLDLTSDKISHIDLIIANPPFSRGAEHINHMFNIAPAGCKIVALCNIETIKNPYSKTRQELKTLVDTYGQYQDLEDCFSTAERKTGVNVALIRLEKPGNNYNQEFSGFFMDEDPEENRETAGLMSYNAIRDLVERYVMSIKIFDQQLETAVRLNDIQKGYFDTKEISITHNQGGVQLVRNDFKKQMQKSGWQWVFSKMNLTKHTTKGLREDINKFVEKQQDVPFTMRNIYHMLDMVIQTTGQRMDKAIIEVFEKLTKHAHENRHKVEGWKTNSHYLLTEKFIMPHVFESDFSGGVRETFYGWAEPLNDLVKAMCFVIGINYDDLTYPTLSMFTSQINMKWGEWHSWAFFEIKAFKKGTAHVKFQNKDHWAMLNQRIAKIKGYPLPEKKEQTAYQKRQTHTREAQPMYKKGNSTSSTTVKPKVLVTIKL